MPTTIFPDSKSENITRRQLVQGLAVTLALAETLRVAKELPLGMLYVACMGKVDYQGFEKAVDILVNAGVAVRGDNHLLRWTGKP